MAFDTIKPFRAALAHHRSSCARLLLCTQASPSIAACRPGHRSPAAPAPAAPWACPPPSSTTKRTPTPAASASCWLGSAPVAACGRCAGPGPAVRGWWMNVMPINFLIGNDRKVTASHKQYLPIGHSRPGPASAKPLVRTYTAAPTKKAEAHVSLTSINRLALIQQRCVRKLSN